jgi:ABC-2 type transport system ATP-binding protein
MIQAEDLSKQFEEFQAVDGVNLQVGAGEVLALLGPNGAGKTTTVRMLTSVLRPTRGWARVAGYDVVQDAAKVRAAVGVLTEQHGLYNRMPAYAYLDFFGKIYHMNADKRQKSIRGLLEGFGLDPDDKRPTGEYSKGMRQKLALARALIHDPPVLLLDEPTSAMDPESARLVRNSIHGLRSANRAIIICTHNLPEAEELADKIAIIRRGKIIIQGSAADLKRRFLGPAEFEVRFSANLNGSLPALPEQVRLTHQGENWLRYQTEQPQQINPLLLRALLANGLPVVSLQEVSHSLEQVYLQAINVQNTSEELSDGG